jgi:hypothetical protein
MNRHVTPTGILSIRFRKPDRVRFRTVVRLYPAKE